MFRNIKFILPLLVVACSPATEDFSVLPIVEISTPEGYVYSRSWVEAQIVIDDSVAYKAKIRGRGNSTFAQPKHPYSIEFENDTAVLDLPHRSKYKLLANFFDHSHIRNALALEVARQTSLAAYTPRGRFVALTFNGEQQGIYYLVESPKTAAASDSVYKIDAYSSLDEDLQSVPVLPIDTASFVDYFIVQELCQNAEPNGPRSVYLHVRNGKLFAGPVWDFDLAFINVGVDENGDLCPDQYRTFEPRPVWLRDGDYRWLNQDSLYNRQSIIFSDFLGNAHFANRVRERWHYLQPKMLNLTAFIDSCDNVLRPISKLDDERWLLQDGAKFDNSASYGTSIETLRANFVYRVKVLDELFDNL